MKPVKPTIAAPSTGITALWRGLLFLLVWLVLMPSLASADLAVGAVAALFATLTSLRLLPPAAGHVRLSALLGFLPHFLWQSVLAGIDVARRALHPEMPMRPGFVACPVGFPPGLARNEFTAITSLLPGSVPAGDTADGILYHCLDVGEPVAQQMAQEESLLARVLVAGQRHV